MSVTNSEVIRDALAKIGVLRETETLSAEQGAHGLRVLNDMMEEWEVRGIERDYYPQTSLTATFPSEDVACVKDNLAVELAADYNRAVSPQLAVRADEYLKRKTRDAVRDNAVEQDVTHVPMGEGHWIWKDISDL